jgi:hypothetical protein
MTTPDLRFPIGRFEKPETCTLEELQNMLNALENFPNKVIALAGHLPAEQLNWRYRPDGWTLKQVVHHCSDSHFNCLLRVKLSLTEDKPVIKPYIEAKWAELPDSLEDNLSASIQILKGVHYKLNVLLRTLSEDDLKRIYIHPQYNSTFSIMQVIALYSWHCNHHYAHMEQAILSKGKYN